jgi:hypothetical protein
MRKRFEIHVLRDFSRYIAFSLLANNYRHLPLADLDRKP